MQKTIERTPGFYTEAEVVDCAPKAIPVLTVFNIVSRVGNLHPNERKLVFRGLVPSENMYQYSQFLLGEIVAAYVDAEREILKKVLDSGELISLGMVASLLRQPERAVRAAIREVFGENNSVVKRRGGQAMASSNLVDCLKPLFETDESLYKAYTCQRQGNGGRRVEPKPTLHHLEWGQSLNEQLMCA